MSSMTREISRSAVEAACTGVVRRMVSLPRSILGSVSRVMGQGIMDLMGIGRGRRNHPHPHPQHLHHLSPDLPFHHPPEFPMSDPFEYSLPYSEPTSFPHGGGGEWVFLNSFEQEYGTAHPFFYACRFVDALKMAQNEHKFIFLYLHSPEHPFTPGFCRGTLCSEVVIQFLDANFICWAALPNIGEGFHLASTLRAATFPFCAVVAPASGDNIAVLRQLEGPVSPAELVETLQRTMEEQGLAFGSGRAKEEEKRRADRRLREEQDLAYLAALRIDQDKEKHDSSTSGQAVPFPKQTARAEAIQKSNNNARGKGNSQMIQGSLKQQQTTGKHKETTRTGGVLHRDNAGGKGDAEVTQILIRFPNGERKEHSFLSTDKIQAIFHYVDSLGLAGVGKYRLVSNFPRKVYGSDEMGMTLKDAGLPPKASLFLELL